MNLKTSINVAVFIILNLVRDARSSGVLTIRLTGFRNPFGRTYDGTCCDPSPRDRNPTCIDQCDYVMRLIVMGLGRANDHVFLFHRPLKYDSNNIEFENGDSNLLLTVLFDSWPQDGQVRMNAFFYDYDDFDHTTTLVDWFETDLKHTSNNTDVWGHFQEQSVVGNRQSDKTLLTFEWSALHSEHVHNPEFHSDNTQNNSKVNANINIKNSNLKKSIIQKQGSPIWAGSPFRKNDEQLFYEEFTKRKPIVASVKSVYELLDKKGTTTIDTDESNNKSIRGMNGDDWDKNTAPLDTDGLNLSKKSEASGDDPKYDERFQQNDINNDVTKLKRFTGEKSAELKSHEMKIISDKKLSAHKRINRNKGMKKQFRKINAPFKSQILHLESNDILKDEKRQTIGEHENSATSIAVTIPDLHNTTTSAHDSVYSINKNVYITDKTISPVERIDMNIRTTSTDDHGTSEKPISGKLKNDIIRQANKETEDLTSGEPSNFEIQDPDEIEPFNTTPTPNQMITIESVLPNLLNNKASNDFEVIHHSQNNQLNDLNNFKRKIPKSEPYINTIYKTAFDHHNKAFPSAGNKIMTAEQMLGTMKEQTNSESSTLLANGYTSWARHNETSLEGNENKIYTGLKTIEVTPAFENNIISELRARKYPGQLDKLNTVFLHEEMTTDNLAQDNDKTTTTSTIAKKQYIFSSPFKDGSQHGSAFSTAPVKEYSIEEPAVGKYQSREVTVKNDSNETKKFEFVQIVNRGEDIVPLEVDFTTAPQQNDHSTNTKYTTQPEQDAIEINKNMIDPSSSSSQTVLEKQDGQVASVSSLDRLQTTPGDMESTTEREQPKVWFNARKSHQSNGELLQKNIKVLKTFKFETAAPFHWYVTAQRPYVRQQSRQAPKELYPNTFQDTTLSDKVDTLIEVENLQTDITTNGFMSSFDNWAIESSTKSPDEPGPISNDILDRRGQYEILSPHSEIDEKHIKSINVGSSTLNDTNASDHNRLNNGILTTVENTDDKTTKSYTTFDIPLFFIPIKGVHGVENINDGQNDLLDGDLSNSETFSKLTDSSMISTMTKSPSSSMTSRPMLTSTMTKSPSSSMTSRQILTSTMTKSPSSSTTSRPMLTSTMTKSPSSSTTSRPMLTSTMTKSPSSSTTSRPMLTSSTISSHVNPVISYQNKSVSREQPLDESKFSDKDVVFLDIMNLIEKFDTRLNSPKHLGAEKTVIKSEDITGDVEGRNIYSDISQFVKEEDILEKIRKSEQTNSQEQKQDRFIKEMIDPSITNGLVTGTVHEPSRQNSNPANNNKKDQNVKDTSIESETVLKERDEGRGHGTKMNHKQVYVSISNITEQQENFPSKGSRGEKSDFGKEENNPEYLPEVSDEDQTGIKYDDITGKNRDGNSHQSQSVNNVEKHEQVFDIKSMDTINAEDRTLNGVNATNKPGVLTITETIPSIFLDNKKDKQIITRDTAHEDGQGFEKVKVIKANNTEVHHDGKSDRINVAKTSKIKDDDIANNYNLKDKQLTTQSNKDDNNAVGKTVNEYFKSFTQTETSVEPLTLSTTRIAPNDKLPVTQTQTPSKKSTKHTQQSDQYLDNESQVDTVTSPHEIHEDYKLKSVESDDGAVDSVFDIVNSQNDEMVETLNRQASTPMIISGKIKEYQPPLDIESYSLRKETLEEISLSAPKRKTSTLVTHKNSLPITVPNDGNRQKGDILNTFKDSDLKENIERSPTAGTNMSLIHHNITSDAGSVGYNKNVSRLKAEASTAVYHSNTDTTVESNELFKSTIPSREVTGQYIKASSSVFNPREMTTTTLNFWPQKEDIRTPEFIKRGQIVEHLARNVVEVTTVGTMNRYSGSHLRSNDEHFQDTNISDQNKEDSKTNSWHTDFKNPAALSKQFPNKETEAQFDTKASVVPSSFENTILYNYQSNATHLEDTPRGNISDASLSNDVLPQESLNRTTHDPFSLMNLFIANFNLLETLRDKKKRNNDSQANVTGFYQNNEEIRMTEDEGKLNNVDVTSFKEDNFIYGEDRHTEFTREPIEQEHIEATHISNNQEHKVVSRDSRNFKPNATNNEKLSNDFSSDEQLSDAQNLYFNTGDKKFTEMPSTKASTGDRQEKENINNLHEQLSHQTNYSNLYIALNQSTVTSLSHAFTLPSTSDQSSSLSLSHEDNLKKNISEEIQPGDLITTESIMTMDSTLYPNANISTGLNFPVETWQDLMKTAATRKPPPTTQTSATSKAPPISQTSATSKAPPTSQTSATARAPKGNELYNTIELEPFKEVPGSGQNLQNTISLDSYPKIKSLGSDIPKDQEPKYLPSIMNPVLYIPPKKASLERQPVMDLPSDSHPKVVLHTEMKTLPENGFKLHTVTRDSFNNKPTNQPLNELPWLKLSRVNTGFKRNNVHRKINLDKLRSYIQDIRHGPSVHIPRQGLYAPEQDANQTLRAPDAAAVLPSAVERYGSPYTSIHGVSTVFTRYWPAVLGVTIGTMFLLTALITSILCRQRRLLVQRASWSDSPQYLSEPPDPSEYATSSATSLSSDLTRSSVNLVGRHS